MLAERLPVVSAEPTCRGPFWGCFTEAQLPGSAEETCCGSRWSGKFASVSVVCARLLACMCVNPGCAQPGSSGRAECGGGRVGWCSLHPLL